MTNNVFRALAEPHRREMLQLLRGTERSAGEIASFFDITRPAVSQHLRVLAEAGLVVVRQEGTRRLYRARPEGLLGVRAFLAEFWDQRLRRLKQAAEEEEYGASNRER